MVWIPIAAAAAIAAASTGGGHALSRRAQNKDRRRQERKQREREGSYSGKSSKSERVRSNKHNQTELARYLKDSKTSYKDFRKDIAEYNRDRKGWMKKYGGEKFVQHDALNKGQRKLLDKYLKRSGKFQKLPNVENYPEIPGLESNPLFQGGSNALANILKNPESGYGEFRDPMVREFEQEIAPAIASRYGGQRSSGFQNRLASAGRDLGSKLGALRAGLSREAMQFAIPQSGNFAQQQYANRANAAQQRFANQQQIYGNKVGENQFNASLGQLSLGTNPYTSIYRPPTFLTNTPTQGGVVQPNFNQYQPGAARQPGFWQNAGNSFASGAVNAAGTAAGNAITNKFGDWFSNTSTPAASAANTGVPYMNSGQSYRSGFNSSFGRLPRGVN